MPKSKVFQKCLKSRRVSKSAQKCQKCPSQAWGLPFKGSLNVCTDFYGDAQHHHRSHTYVYFYSNKAALITNWTSIHTVINS